MTRSFFAVSATNRDAYYASLEVARERFLSDVEACGVLSEKLETQLHVARLDRRWGCKNGEEGMLRGFVSLKRIRSCWYCFNHMQQRWKLDETGEQVSFPVSWVELLLAEVPSAEPAVSCNVVERRDGAFRVYEIDCILLEAELELLALPEGGVS